MSLNKTKEAVKKLDEHIRLQYRLNAELDRALEIISVTIANENKNLDKDYAAMAIRAQYKYRKTYLDKLYGLQISEAEEAIWQEILKTLE